MNRISTQRDISIENFNKISVCPSRDGEDNRSTANRKSLIMQANLYSTDDGDKINYAVGGLSDFFANGNGYFPGGY